jgi:hypothetical protein
VYYKRGEVVIRETVNRELIFNRELSIEKGLYIINRIENILNYSYRRILIS